MQFDAYRSGTPKPQLQTGSTEFIQMIDLTKLKFRSPRKALKFHVLTKEKSTASLKATAMQNQPVVSDRELGLLVSPNHLEDKSKDIEYKDSIDLPDILNIINTKKSSVETAFNKEPQTKKFKFFESSSFHFLEDSFLDILFQESNAISVELTEEDYFHQVVTVSELVFDDTLRDDGNLDIEKETVSANLPDGEENHDTGLLTSSKSDKAKRTSTFTDFHYLANFFGSVKSRSLQASPDTKDSEEGEVNIFTEYSEAFGSSSLDELSVHVDSKSGKFKEILKKELKGVKEVYSKFDDMWYEFKVDTFNSIFVVTEPVRDRIPTIKSKLVFELRSFSGTTKNELRYIREDLKTKGGKIKSKVEDFKFNLKYHSKNLLFGTQIQIDVGKEDPVRYDHFTNPDYHLYHTVGFTLPCNDYVDKLSTEESPYSFLGNSSISEKHNGNETLTETDSDALNKSISKEINKSDQVIPGVMPSNFLPIDYLPEENFNNKIFAQKAVEFGDNWFVEEYRGNHTEELNNQFAEEVKDEKLKELTSIPRENTTQEPTPSIEGSDWFGKENSITKHHEKHHKTLHVLEPTRPKTKATVRGNEHMKARAGRGKFVNQQVQFFSELTQNHIYS